VVCAHSARGGRARRHSTRLQVHAWAARQKYSSAVGPDRLRIPLLCRRDPVDRLLPKTPTPFVRVGLGPAGGEFSRRLSWPATEWKRLGMLIVRPQISAACVDPGWSCQRPAFLPCSRQAGGKLVWACWGGSAYAFQHGWWERVIHACAYGCALQSFLGASVVSTRHVCNDFSSFRFRCVACTSFSHRFALFDFLQVLPSPNLAFCGTILRLGQAVVRCIFSINLV